MTKLRSPWAPDADPAAWDTITIAGIVFHGKVEVDGDLWKKKNDHRRARGHSGSRTVATGWDAGEFSITLSAFDDATDDELARIIDAVTLRTPTADDNAIPVSHPVLLAASINQATFEGASAPKPSDAGGLLVWESKWKEHKPPTTRDATRTVGTAAQGPELQRAGLGAYATAAGPELPGAMRPIPPPPPTAAP